MGIKKLSKTVIWLVLIALIASFPIIVSQLPSTSEGWIQQSSHRWAGVLRLWISDSWAPGYGSFTPWLNACLAKFEKRHPGVFVQVIPVSSAMMEQFAAGDINPPDIILFPPGLLGAPDHLIQLEDSYALRGGLSHSGNWQGGLYAVPIAMGGYAWAYNMQLLTRIPDDWRDIGKQPQAKTGTYGSKQKTELYWLNFPTDAPFISWSTALCGLFADRKIIHSDSGEPQITAPVGDGIDLGLPMPSTAPTPINEMPEAVEEAEMAPCYLPEHLPGDFRQTESVYKAFTSGQVAAIPVTQREIRRLQILGESGRAPDWAIESRGDIITDQLAMFSIVDWPRDDSEARQALCAQLLNHFLSEESQQALSSIRAFPVIDTAPLYSSQQGMAQLEAALRGSLSVPNAFDLNWRANQKRKADMIQSR